MPRIVDCSDATRGRKRRPQMLYGHPHDTTLQALSEITVLRTDELGTIIISSDGQNITVDHSQSGDDSTEPVYIGNRKSMKFHYPDCPGIIHINPANSVPISSREDAIALGYVPCGQCKP